MRVVRYCLAIAIIFSLSGAICSPLRASWYKQKGLCLSIHSGFLPGVYTKERARLAIPELERSLEFYPSWEARFLLGLAYSQLEELGNAEREYVLSLEYNPNYAKAYYNLGNIYYRMGKYDKAVECYLRCLKIDYSFVLAQNNLKVIKKLRR